MVWLEYLINLHALEHEVFMAFCGTPNPCGPGYPSVQWDMMHCPEITL